MASEVFPYDIQTVTKEEDKLIKKYYKDFVRPFVRVGPSRTLNSAAYGEVARDIYNVALRHDDIWVCSFSRSGTTWLQELVWLVANNLDFETAKARSLNTRCNFIEYSTLKSEDKYNQKSYSAVIQDFRSLPSLASPRFIKTHLPLSLLPPKLLDVSKVFYIARHPLDVAVSLFFFLKLIKDIEKDVTLEEFWQLFKKDLVFHAPVFEHVNEAWLKRNRPNLMFLFYEDMQNDLPGVIDRVCAHLQRDYSPEQKRRLAEYLSFDNLKKYPPAYFESFDNSDDMQFIRKGKSGNWVNYFSGELRKDAELYMENYFAKTDMRFPEVNMKV